METKTTDTYTIELDRLANYRKKLALEKKIELEKSSILIVVGRSETDSVEAQVRGSRHAWDIRLISVEALLRLVTVKVELEDPQVVQKIQQILRPKEYTKVDDIIDLVFSAAKDVKEEEGLAPEMERHDEKFPEATESVTDAEKKFSQSHFREGCIARLQDHLRIGLVKRSRARYSSADDRIGIICLNSKKYETNRNHPICWFAFHPYQKEGITNYKQGYVAFGCGSPDTIILIPAKEFIGWVEKGMFWTTKRQSGFYWHVTIEVSKTKLLVDTMSGHPRLDVTQYLVK